MKNIEIPYVRQRGRRYRFFEILPGTLSWFFLSLPLILSLISTRVTMVFIVAYLLLWFTKAVGLNVRSLQGFRTIDTHSKLPWQRMMDDLTGGTVENRGSLPGWHHTNVEKTKNGNFAKPKQIIHALIIASYNETIEIIEPTVKAVIDSDYDMKQVILVFAYEGRDGAQSESAVKTLAKKYGSKFKHCIAAKHPVTKDEVKGKGGNITYAARELQKYFLSEKFCLAFSP